MLKSKNVYGYSRKKKYIMGRGFVDSMSSVFRNIASYVSTNKDLIAKPLLGAIGSLAATGLTAGVPALISHIANRNKKRDAEALNDPKYREILQSMIPQPPATNIIGAGGAGVRRQIGAGIKRF